MAQSTPPRTLAALLEAVQLKALPRAGWLRVGVQKPESVAAHSWGVAWLVLVLLPDELNRERALSYAVLHDLAELRVGDITPYDGVPHAQKQAREQAAMRALCDQLGPRGQQLWADWQAYERQADAESQFVRQLDRLDMALQARAYAKDGYDVRAFFASARAAITHPQLLAVLDAISLEADSPP